MPSPFREHTTKAHYTFYPADSIGGELYYSAGLSVMSDIYSPKSGQPLPVKAHCWLNAGRLDGIDRSMSFHSSPPILQLLITAPIIAVPLKQTVLASLSRPSLSAGVGIIYRLDPVRVELNFGVPLACSRSDGARRGLQVGMGLEFM
jgi:outer membrane protein insertion porin family